jgi:hypothetical protein
MKRTMKKKQVHKSMKEFEESFFPNSLKKQLEESMDLPTLAVSLAEESLEKIRRQLVK